MAIIQLNVNSTHSITLGYKGEHNADIIEVIVPDSVVGGSIYLDLLLPDLTKTQTPALVDNKYTVPGDLLQTAGKGYIDVLHKKDGNVDVLCHCFLTVLDAVNASDTLVPEYQDVISQWEGDEAARKAAELLRGSAEDTRIENEDEREDAEGLREQAETARENAEDLRDTAEGQRELAEGEREAAYIVAEGLRDTAYGVAEGVRDGLYTTAEGSRNTAYGEAEDARDGLYATAEGVRDSDYALAEGLRDDDYADAEDARDVLYEAREDLRDTIVGGLDARVKVTELQTATQQKELNDIERLVALMNPTQSVRVDITDARQTVSLPKTAGVGLVNATLKGLTATQLLTYTPTTWVEWIKTAGVVGDSTGMEFTSDATTSKTAIITTTVKNSTKYGFLYNVVSSNIDKSFYGSSTITNDALAFVGTAGMKKLVVTTKAAIATNNITIVLHSSNTAGRKIKIKDFRLFELPTGSQIEADFTNLTADQLNNMYPLFIGTQSAIAPRLRCVNEDETETSTLYTEPLTLRSNATDQDTITPTDGKMIYQQRIDPSTYATLDPLPAPIEVATSGVLQSYPSGTIYAEHALADAGIYSTNIEVVNTDFPIESLESLYIVDPLTGALTELDESTATVAVDGLSFTHAGLTSGDIVFFTYFYAFSGVWGENTYSHFDGTIVKKDTSDSKFYKLGWTVTNGVVTMTATEVT